MKALGFHAAFARFLTYEVQRDMAHHPHILRRSARANAAGIFVKDDVEHPMDALFDALLAPYQRVHLGRGAHLIQEIIPLFGRGAPINRALDFDQGDTRQIAPAVAVQ